MDVTTSLSIFSTHFLAILVEAVPFLLIGTLASGLIASFITADDVARFVPRRRLLATLGGAFLGFVFPVLACGVVPVVRRLYRKGLPLSAGVAFLLAAPVLNPITLVSTYVAFGFGAVLIGRFAITLLVAVSVGLLFAGLARPTDVLHDAPMPPVIDTPPRRSIGAGLRDALRLAWGEFFEIGRYLLLGAALAAALQTVIRQDTLLALGGDPFASVVAMHALAFTLGVDSLADAFRAQAFVGTVSVGAILAFLTFGAMVDVKSALMFLRVFRWRAVLALILLPALLTLFIGVALNVTALTPPHRARVAYLAPADDSPVNIWIATPGEPDSAVQLTHSVGGIYDFAPSPDGRYIAYSETNPATITEDIHLLDLETAELRQLTNCVDASCTNPTWRPDGDVIAYERVEYSGAEDTRPTRVWLIDVTVNPATTTPLFSDTQVLGFDPQWSADGSRIAVFDRSSADILIYNFADDSGISIPTRAGTSGALAPDGLSLVYPEVILQEDSQSRTALQVANLVDENVQPLAGSDEFASDESAAWLPDGSQLAVGRRYLDERYTLGSQIVLIDPVTGDIQPLTDDPRYTNGFFSWDADGERLVIQRLPLLNEAGEPDTLARPEIWTYDMATGEMVQVAHNAFLPRWVP